MKPPQFTTDHAGVPAGEGEAVLRPITSLSEGYFCLEIGVDAHFRGGTLLAGAERV